MDEDKKIQTEQDIVPEVNDAAPAPAATRSRPKPASLTIKELGVMLDSGNDLVEAEMPGKSQRQEIERMQRAIKEGAICYGHVIGVENGNKSVVIRVMRDTLHIIIPAEDFFAYSNMKDMDKESAEGKLVRYRRKASHMLHGAGAAVSFIPKAIGYNEQGVPFVVASRKEAMERLQEKFFFAPNAPAKVGVMAKASILSVGPRYVTVECMGLEEVIGTGNLSATTYIEDASKEYHVGDGLVVAIEKLDVDKENHHVSATFSHALVERLEAKVEVVSERLIGGRYKATVVALIPDYYVVIINCLKIRGLIPRNGGYVGDDELNKDDKVVMQVTGINEEKNMLIGRCLRGQ